MKKKMETSKKLALFSSICFATVLIFSIVLFGYSVYMDKMIDYTMLITIITVTGAAFGTTCAFYYNKARAENLIKLQTSSLKTKYLILKDIGSLDECRVQAELDNEMSEIESVLDSETMIASQEISYNG